MGKPALEQTSKHKSKNDVKKEMGMYRENWGWDGGDVLSRPAFSAFVFLNIVKVSSSASVLVWWNSKLNV